MFSSRPQWGELIDLLIQSNLHLAINCQNVRIAIDTCSVVIRNLKFHLHNTSKTKQVPLRFLYFEIKNNVFMCRFLHQSKR